MKKLNILICEDDRRSAAAGQFFRYDGHRIIPFCSDFEDYNDIDICVLPVPSFKDGMLNFTSHFPAEQMFSELRSGTAIFASLVPEFIYRFANEYNLTVYDYAAREDFCVYNAIPTAEGAIMCAMERLDKTLFGSEFAILGYGRIGKALSARLISLGGHVTVACRSSSALANAECDGCKPCEIGDFLSKPYNGDVLFNTVPCPIIPLDFFKDSCCDIFIELASSPGGFDAECLNYKEKSVIKALGLPGKYSPFTAGEIIYKTVNKILNEKERFSI